MSLDHPQEGRMRAASVAAPGSLEVLDLPIPEPQAGQIRIRVEGCGICASNLEVWKGQPWFEYPLEPGAPGHEGWGRVDSTDPAWPDIKLGDRVAFLSGHAYADYDIAGADQIVKIPDELDGKPFPGEAIGCAMNIFRRSDIGPRQTVAIVGIGFLGALLTQLAVNAGARVIAISRRQFALDIAKQFGAEATFQMGDTADLIEQVKDLTGGNICERVIEAVGNQQALDLAGELCAERARMMIAGYHQDGGRNVNMWLWNWRGLDVINTHERDPRVYIEGIQLAIDAVVDGKMDPFPLLTHSYDLNHLDDGLNALRDRPDGFLKAVITI
jgi:threonine dehydrogenase-like Zn-dependent dehydrogenase